MKKRFIYHNPGHVKHKGWVDSKGKTWDVPKRVLAVIDILKKDSMPSEWTAIVETQKSTVTTIKKLHSPEMMKAMEIASNSVPKGGISKTSFDKDSNIDSSALHPGTYEQALQAAECSIAAAEALLSGEKRMTVALSRPPGHHSGRAFYHGFCFFNNAAIAAQALKDKGKRVAILDIDVHHGDGTQDILYKDGRILYVSLHADPKVVQPGTGFANETGEGEGKGATLNLPYPVGVPVADYLDLLEIAKAKIRNFNPDFLVVEAGFDTHSKDFADLPPITQLATPDYKGVGKSVGELKMPTLVILGGGYNLNVMPQSFLNFIKGVEATIDAKAD